MTTTWKEKKNDFLITLRGCFYYNALDPFLDGENKRRRLTFEERRHNAVLYHKGLKFLKSVDELYTIKVWELFDSPVDECDDSMMSEEKDFFFDFLRYATNAIKKLRCSPLAYADYSDDSVDYFARLNGQWDFYLLDSKEHKNSNNAYACFYSFCNLSASLLGVAGLSMSLLCMSYSVFAIAQPTAMLTIVINPWLLLIASSLLFVVSVKLMCRQFSHASMQIQYMRGKQAEAITDFIEELKNIPFCRNSAAAAPSCPRYEQSMSANGI